MESITSRTRYLDKYTTNGVNEYDLGSFTQTDFDFGDEIHIMLEHEDVGRPDLISQKCYGTTNYWWFIMWYNGISDVWNDLCDGIILKIPQLDKVREFLKTVGK